MARTDVIVLGAGVVGTSIALHLVKGETRVLDQRLVEDEEETEGGD